MFSEGWILQQFVFGEGRRVSPGMLISPSQLGDAVMAPDAR